LLAQAIPTTTDMKYFSYASSGATSYQASDTCQSLAISETLLKNALDVDRGQYAHVVLVGHSLGGVLAFDVGSQPGEAGFVSRIVTIDAPLGGVDGLERVVGQDVMNGFSCPALSELRSRLQDAGWQAKLAGVANAALGRGQQLLVVSNDQDNAVTFAEQQINANVNLQVSVPDGAATPMEADDPDYEAWLRFLRR
jgi:pimeloyl-ACP methyl ester carboxylesterase